jgi:glycine/D-amino acid oxidase-like deaminating enzyme
MKDKSSEVVIIVGGGLAGLTTAVALAKRNIAVKIIQDSSDLRAGTPACHGISTIKGILESDASLFGLKLLGHRGFSAWLRNLEEMLGTTRPPEVWTEGVCERFPDRHDFQKDIGWIYRKEFMGAKQVVLRTTQDSNYVEAYYPGDWWIDPSYLIATLRQAAQKLGVIFQEGRVEGVAMDGQQVSLSLGQGEVDRETCVILCAGAGIVRLMSLAGARKYDWFAVPGYTYIGDYEAKETCLVKRTSGLTAKAGRIHWGSASETATALTGLDIPLVRARTPEDEMQVAEIHLHKFIKNLNPRDVKNFCARWGVRVRTRSRAPAIDCIRALPAGGLWINAGYYKSGIILSWMMAEELAENIMNSGL